MHRAMLLVNHDGEKAKEKSLLHSVLSQRNKTSSSAAIRMTMETDMHAIGLLIPITCY